MTCIPHILVARHISKIRISFVLRCMVNWSVVCLDYSPGALNGLYKFDPQTQDVSRDMHICPTTYIEIFWTCIFPYILINILDMNETLSLVLALGSFPDERKSSRDKVNTYYPKANIGCRHPPPSAPRQTVWTTHSHWAPHLAICKWGSIIMGVATLRFTAIF